MSSHAEAAALLAQDAEQSLINLRAKEGPTNAELNSAIQTYRAAAEQFIIADFAFAHEQKVETRLWIEHTKVNDRYRRQLKRLRDNGKNTAVEKRRLLKYYLEFIKASQRHYRQHALQLNAMYGEIPALRKEAENWKHEVPSVSTSHIFAPGIRLRILQSCSQTVVRLGDLSRYRATEIDEKPDWSHAKGYYNLAIVILPEAGNAHHQLALIARADNDHFRILYHLYRSAATKDKLPGARGHIDLEFKRVRTAWDNNALIPHSIRDGSPAIRSMIAWLLRLHSKCHPGEDFAEHDELESEVISQMVVQVKERSLDGILQRIVISNIAAEYVASTRLHDPDTDVAAFKAFYHFLRLNVKTFFALLQVLQPELEKLTEEIGREDVSSTNGNAPKKLSDKVTVVARRVLPVLRLYSMWFTQYWQILTSGNPNLSETDIHELLKAYTSTLSLLASAFPETELAQLDSEYLLEEDADTVGFVPLVGSATARYWYEGDQLKKRWSDSDVKRYHPNDEMLIRIRDLLIDGLELTQIDAAPIDLDGRRFLYRETGLPSELLASPHNHTIHSPELSVEISDIAPHRPIADDQHSRIARSETNSILSKDTALHRMVDNLVEGDDTLDPLHEEDENLPPTPPAQTFDDTVLINNSSYGLTPNAGNTKQRRTSSRGELMFTSPGGLQIPGSPGVRQMPSLPSLPGESAIWNPDFSSNPGSPYMRDTAILSSRGSASNLLAQNGVHSHNHSLTSHSQTQSPRFDGYSSVVTMPRSSVGGYNANAHGFGPVLPKQGAGGIAYDPGMNSSNLWPQGLGVGMHPPVGTTNPWGSPGMERERSSGGNRNGQGG